VTDRGRRRWIGPAIVAAIVVVAVFALQPRGATTPNGAATSPSTSAGASDAAGDPGATSDPEATPAGPPPDPGHEVYGFVPYWEMDHTIAAHLAKTDLSTLALFSVTHDRTGKMATNQNGYRKITGDLGRQLIREAHQRKTRVELVYTSFGATKNQRFYADEAAQATWIAALVDFVDEHDLDGVNVDVESLDGEDIDAYAAFVGHLRAALRDRNAKWQVSVDTTGGAKGIAMAAAASAAGADRIFLMGYDYHYERSQPGATSPLDDVDGSGASLRTSLDAYAAVGVPPERTLLGLPLYGMTWPVEGPDIGAASTANGDEWIPRLNLRVFEAAGFDPQYEAIESVEFYSVEKAATAEEIAAAASADPLASPTTTQWHAVYFDSPRSLMPKMVEADTRGLAGVGFWAIGYERGLPGYRELIRTFADGKLEAPPG
jgi:spore germination protein YaaH